jgi:steroid delta-isomerase-like uncharacterized protein
MFNCEEKDQPMSKTAEIVKSYYDAFNHKRWDRFFELLTDDVVHDINQGSREVGKKAFHAFMERMNKCYDEQAVDLVVLVGPNEDRAAAEFQIKGKYLATDEGLPPAKGQKYQLQCGAFLALKSHKICRVTNYYNLNDWLAQVKKF